MQFSFDIKSPKILVIFTFVLAFAFQMSAQEIQFPNELEGYEFFGKGKLKDLKLTVSTKDDVGKIFGKTCEKHCDYDSDWSISFEYFDDVWIINDRNDKNEKLEYRLDSKYLGKLRLIEIRPKKQLSFANVSFSASFRNLLIASTSSLSGDEVFQDSNGLTYEIKDEAIIYESQNKPPKIYNKGDLVLIRYAVSEESRKTLFVLQK